MNEAFVLPLTQKEHKETLESNSDITRGSYKTYIHNTNTYKRNTKATNSDLLFYQLKEH